MTDAAERVDGPKTSPASPLTGEKAKSPNTTAKPSGTVAPSVKPPVIIRNASKSRNSRQRADEAWKFDTDEDIMHSIQELTVDNYLQKLFPGE